MLGIRCKYLLKVFKFLYILGLIPNLTDIIMTIVSRFNVNEISKCFILIHIIYA